MTTNLQKLAQKAGTDAAKPAAVPSPRQVGDRVQVFLNEVERFIVGKRQVLEYVTAAVITEGAHVLFEDMPGLAKSVMAATMSRASGATFKRVQFTPDLLPGDVTGTYVFDQKTSTFEFRRGPIFTNFLLADEINRASPKTQSALLEAMAEKQVSVEGQTHRLAKPFLVLATQNPVEQEGTYPLPEAQLDRFMLKLSMGYPDHRDEVEIMRRRNQRGTDEFDVQRVLQTAQIGQMQAASERVRVDAAIYEYISTVVQATRSHPHLQAGASPRGSLALMKLAKSLCVIRRRDFVTPDIVKELAVPILAHRLILKPEARVRGVDTADVVNDILGETPVPKV